MGLFTIFGTSLRALNAYSGAMGIISNNIANSANDDYSRQRYEFQSLSPDKTGGIETGRGIDIAGVSQVVNDFVELRLNKSYQDVGRYDAQTEYLKNIESVMNETDGTGLNNSITEFFNAWTAASAEPESITVRQNILNLAQNMMDNFKTYGDSIADLRSTIDQEVEKTIPQINNLLDNIKNLNQQIQESNTGALSLKDSRRTALNDLAELIDITYLESDDGSLQVYTKSGLPLLNGATTATLGTQVNVGNENHFDVTYSMGATSSTITNLLQGGRLKGLVDARDTYLANYQDDLNDLAYTIVGQVNTLHSAGYDLDSNTGNNFFTALGAVSGAAQTLSLDNSVSGTPRAIALSGDIANVPGGNAQALAIANLYDSTSIVFQDASTNSFAGYLGDLMATVGNNVRISKDNQDLAESVIFQVQLERSEESGVNIDEEQINLVKLQSAYEASGRMLRIADTMLNTLINALIT